MTPAAARERFLRARVARLATAGADGRPHLVPVVFAVAGETVYSAVDRKPKRTARLRRLANAAENPRVALLADHYDDANWDALWWVRADGIARVLPPEADEAVRAVDLLAGRYAQYRTARPEGPVLAVDVERWSGWSAA
ncbi:MAG TPA: TIGR03668 family PPOX class F420-dependent oxidoreductase [Solirubrobacteraceae bacterium]|nr:TIGR03668 family PPOX class F420-dependent oxidoreductase [Solirubrobacteraceae bacterium]